MQMSSYSCEFYLKEMKRLIMLVPGGEEHAWVLESLCLCTSLFITEFKWIMQTGVVVMSCKWEGSRGVILCAVVHTELYGVR